MRLIAACELITKKTGHYIDREALRNRVSTGKIKGRMVDGLCEVLDSDIERFCETWKGKMQKKDVKRGKDKCKRGSRKEKDGERVKMKKGAV